MKSIFNYILPAFFSIVLSLGLFSCSGGSSEKTDASNEEEVEVVASDNFNEMNKQIDNAIAKGNYAFAFDVLNSIPSHFDSYSRFYYNNKTGDMGSYDSKEGRTKEFTYDQYCRKAVSVLRAESDVLLSKNDPEAEGLFLEHLADFDLGVNNVNTGKYGHSDEVSGENKRYQEAVTIYNDYLISVIRKALLKNKPEIAKKVSLLIRDGLSFTKDPNYEYDWIWKYDTEAKDEANEIINSFSAE